MALAQFHLFKNLPSEIRIIIWEYSLDNQPLRLGATPMHYIALGGSIPLDLGIEDMSEWADNNPTLETTPIDIKSVQFDGEHPSVCVAHHRLRSVCYESRYLMRQWYNVNSRTRIRKFLCPPSSDDDQAQPCSIKEVAIGNGKEKVEIMVSPEEDLFVIQISDVARLMWWHQVFSTRYLDPSEDITWSSNEVPLQNIGLEVDEAWLDNIPENMPSALREPQSPFGLMVGTILEVEGQGLPCHFWLIDRGHRNQSSTNTLSLPRIFYDGGESRGEFVETELREEAEDDRTIAEIFYMKLREVVEGYWAETIGTCPNLHNWVSIICWRGRSVSE